MPDGEEQIVTQLESEPLDFQALFESKDAIEFVHDDGRREVFQPDGFKGYFPFTVATAFPSGITAYGIGLYPQSIQNHYRTLLHQHADKDHKMKFNDPSNPNAEDNILGSIVAVSFPRPPNGAAAWKVTDNPQPAIRGVGVFWKNASATRRALGQHIMGRHQSTVSMDLWYGHTDSGFAIKGGTEFSETTPKDFAESGWQYVPYSAAPPELKACFAEKAGGKKRGGGTPGPEDVNKDYKGQKVIFIAGGLGEGSIAFAGLAVVRYGAEPTAKLGHLIAEHPGTSMIDTLAQLPSLLREIGTAQLVKVEEAPAPAKTSDAVTA